MVCVNMSVVGDTTPAMTKAMTMRTFRFPFKNAEEINPNFAKKNKTRGNSKTTPKGIIKAMKNDKYDCSENMGCNESVAKPMKNLTAAGKTA